MVDIPLNKETKHHTIIFGCLRWYIFLSFIFCKYSFNLLIYWLISTARQSVLGYYKTRNKEIVFIVYSYLHFVFCCFLRWFYFCTRSYRIRITFLCIFHLFFFFFFFSFEFRWCSHTEVLIQLLIGKNPVLFFQRDQISIWSISVYAFPMHMLTSLSVDKILLPRNVNWYTHFSGSPLLI